MTKIIGLTGGIATGKSTVADMFVEAGIPIIDTDLIARDVLAVGTDGYNEVLQYFKQDILFSNEEINRKKLGQIVFTNAKKRQKLNSIVHPRVKQIVLNEIDIHKKLNTKIVVIDVPLLFESKFDELTDINIVVFTERDLQVERLIDRDNISLEYAQMKINAQMPLQEKINKADYVIDNSLSILQTKKDFMRVLEEIEVE